MAKKVIEESKTLVNKEVGEFKKFIARGNVIDMAVAVIVGGAFGKIITSLVSDILMPTLGLVLGKVNITELSWAIRPAKLDDAGAEIAPAVVMTYGNFLQNTLDFFIIAFSIYLFLRIILLMKSRAEEPAPPAGPTPTEELLTEIRDLLRDKKDS